MVVVLRVIIAALVLAGGFVVFQAWSEGRLGLPTTALEIPAKGAYRGPPDAGLPAERREELHDRAQRMRF